MDIVEKKDYQIKSADSSVYLPASKAIESNSVEALELLKENIPSDIAEQVFQQTNDRNRQISPFWWIVLISFLLVLSYVSYLLFPASKLPPPVEAGKITVADNTNNMARTSRYYHLFKRSQAHFSDKEYKECADMLAQDAQKIAKSGDTANYELVHCYLQSMTYNPNWNYATHKPVIEDVLSALIKNDQYNLAWRIFELELIDNQLYNYQQLARTPKSIDISKVNAKLAQIKAIKDGFDNDKNFNKYEQLIAQREASLLIALWLAYGCNDDIKEKGVEERESALQICKRHDSVQEFIEMQLFLANTLKNNISYYYYWNNNEYFKERYLEKDIARLQQRLKEIK